MGTAAQATLVIVSVVLVTVGCERRPQTAQPANDAAPPAAEPVKWKPPNYVPRPANVVKFDHPAVVQTEAFLRELMARDFRAAVKRTSASFRQRVGALPAGAQDLPPKGLDEIVAAFLRSEVTDLEGTHAAFLKDEVTALREPKLLYQVLSPSESEISLRGEFGDSRNERAVRLLAFCVRLSLEEGQWRVTRFATAYLVAGAMPPDFDNRELAWARETALDFLEAKSGKDRQFLQTMDLMTEEFKAGLPATAAPDPGLTYARSDVHRWLSVGPFAHEKYVIDEQILAPGRATFDVKRIGRFYMVPIALELVKEGERWKVSSCSDFSW